MATYQPRQRSGGLRSWSRGRRLAIALVLIAFVVVAVIVLTHGGGSSGGGGGY